MKKIIITLTLVFVTHLFGAKIVFDLGGVILNNFSLRAMPSIVYTLGMYNIFNYSVHNTFNHPENRIFEFEDLVYNKKDAESLWLAGKVTSEEFYAKLVAASYDSKYSSFFKNESEKKFLRAAFKFILPETLAGVINITFKSYTVVKQCLLEGHEIFILSNWDPESFPLVKKKCARIFDLFPSDNIYTSGNLKHC
jgi:FMN phosphatase YigB (HAD superfamily)